MGNRRKLITLFILALVLATIWIPEARSQNLLLNGEQVIQKPDTQTIKEQNIIQQDARGTDKTPLVVEVTNFPKPESEADKIKARYDEDAAQHWWVKSDWWGTVFTGLIFVIGAFQLIVFIFQWRAFKEQAGFMRDTVAEMKSAAVTTQDLASAARDSADTAKETAVRQLRAYITLEKAYFDEPKNVGDSWSIQVVIKNRGQTPAYSCAIKTEYKIMPAQGGNPVFPLSINAQPQPKAYMAPAHQAILRIPCPDLSTHGHTWNDCSRAGYRTYLWGRIDYIDCFEQPRFMTFQMVCPMNQVVGFANCLVGNEAD